MYCVIKCIVRGNQARVKNAELRHPSCTVVKQRRKSASPVHNVLIRHVRVWNGEKNNLFYRLLRTKTSHCMEYQQAPCKALSKKSLKHLGWFLCRIKPRVAARYGMPVRGTV